MTCDAKIRPFPDPTELTCEVDEPFHTEHKGTVRDYAYPGSATQITWWENDRRNFRGEWAPCPYSGPREFCILPAGHSGRHAA